MDCPDEKSTIDDGTETMLEAAASSSTAAAATTTPTPSGGYRDTDHGASMVTATSEANNDRTITSPHHKSCDTCRAKKRKCDGSRPCRRCIGRGNGHVCTYSRRQRRCQPAELSSAAVAQSDYLSASLKARADGRVTAALQQRGTEPLKRLSPSPATGLVGMQENVFLSDYFDCIGFLPLTSPSQIRETIVKLMTASTGHEQAHHEEAQLSRDETLAGSAQHPVAGGGEILTFPSLCTFWCAVALGALVRGRHSDSVTGYFEMAKNASERFSGPPTVEVATAWSMLAYVYGFLGDQENFGQGLRRADVGLRECVSSGTPEVLPVGLAEMIEHGEAMKLFVGDPRMDEVESFCSEEISPPPQMGIFPTDRELYRHLVVACRPLQQVFYASAFHESWGPYTGISGDNAHHELLQHQLDADEAEGGDRHAIEAINGCLARSSGLGEAVHLLTSSPSDIEILEMAADRSLVFMKVSNNDLGGVVDKMRRCVEVLERYPGLLVFMMGSHDAHFLATALVAIRGSEARELYDKLRAVYNPRRPHGFGIIPPFDEWQGVSACCDKFFCRSMEAVIKTWPWESISHPKHASEAQPLERFHDDGPAGLSLPREELFPSLVANEGPDLDPERAECETSRAFGEFQESSAGGPNRYIGTSLWVGGTKPGRIRPEVLLSPQRDPAINDALPATVSGARERTPSFDTGMPDREDLCSSGDRDIAAVHRAQPRLLSGLVKGRTMEREEEDAIAPEDWINAAQALADRT